MNLELSPDDLKLWLEYKNAWQKYRESLAGVFHEASDLMSLVRYGMMDDRRAIVDILEGLKPEDIKIVFKELLNQLMDMRTGEFYEKVIFSLPKEWLEENLPKYATEIFQELETKEDVEVEFDLLMSFCGRIDRNLALNLVKKALLSKNYSIQKFAEEWSEGIING
ncbi:MAG: hypothetical protein H7Y09_02695 [Chitinophagaceae bacterium]|nr:hypothetical protein [Anaerolineae bacterium]